MMPGAPSLLQRLLSNGRRHLRSAERKEGFVTQLRESATEAAIELLAWVVLNEHYHVASSPGDPASVPGWLKPLHGNSSTVWNMEENRRGRACWYRSWDVTLWTEGDLWSRINCIHDDPVKHGYVVDAREWRWSSLAEFDAVR